jgi:formylglycine-generating enzyme required for sulfatase activity
VRLLKELDAPDTTHLRRREVGDRLELIGDTRAGVGLRADGMPDIAWCYVPSPTVKLSGTTMSVDLKPFYIARYQITLVQFQAFLAASDGFESDVWWQGFEQEHRKQAMAETTFRISTYPCDHLSWYQAVAFCRWLTAKLPDSAFPDARGSSVWEIRLPTEEEWQLASTGQAYPWGDEWDSSRANTAESGLMRLTAVGMYPAGAAPCGALDLCGNIWEWCLNDYADLRNLRPSADKLGALRGGSCMVDRNLAQVRSRKKAFRFERSANVGLRIIAAHKLVPSASAANE